MASLERIVVLHGPGVPCHRPSLERWCAAQANEWDVVVELIVAEDAGGLLASLHGALGVADGTGVVLAPGALGSDPDVLAAAVARAGDPLIWLELQQSLGAPAAELAVARVQTVRGRGIDGHRWALRSLLERGAWPVTTHAYGEGRDQVCDLRLPAGAPGEPGGVAGGPAGASGDAAGAASGRTGAVGGADAAAGAGGFPVVALVHGGAWRSQWERDLMDALAVDLARRGYATWNVEYRRTGEGGGWPATFEDVAAALDLLAQVDAPLELARVAVIGHSAGGHLGLWAAARHRLSAGAPGAAGAASWVRPSFVLSLAGLPDLADTATRGTYDRGVEPLVGGLPGDIAERYAQASPHALLPLGVPQLLVHGLADQPDNVDMNRIYAERAAAAGDDVELIELDGVEHFLPIEPRSDAWATIVTRFAERFPA